MKVIYPGKDLEVLASASHYTTWVLQHFLPHIGGNTIEIGAGLGEIASRILPQVSTLDLVEPSSVLAEFLQQRFADSNKIQVFPTTLETHLSKKLPKQYNAVIMINVLEHIEDDVTALRELRQTILPGGHLLIYVPAMPILFSKLDKVHGHYRRYTRKEFMHRLQEAGFKINLLRYFDILGILTWYFFNTLGGKTDFNPFAVKLYDSIGVPVTKFLESIILPPIGKNLIAVAVNPTEN
jgi:phospholipid N-methyltransferase